MAIVRKLMFLVNPEPDDDPEFIELAVRLIAGATRVHGPARASAFKVDNWFGHAWLGFAGKGLGQLGVWKEPLTIPPFVANRLVGEWHFEHDPEQGGYRARTSAQQLHFQGPSRTNLYRRVRHLAPVSALYWFSGNTRANGRGSLMGYIPFEQDHWGWFLSFEREREWRITRGKNIDDHDVRRFEVGGAAEQKNRSVNPETLMCPG
jgi:hypothetical protein